MIHIRISHNKRIRAERRIYAFFDESKKDEIEETAITKVQLTKLYNIKKGHGSPRHREDSDETTSLHRGNRGSKVLI